MRFNPAMQMEGREDWQTGPWHAAPPGTLSPGSPCNPDDGSYLFASGRSPFDLIVGPGTSGGFIRYVDFVQPKKPPQSVDANCVSRQQFAVFQGGQGLIGWHGSSRMGGSLLGGMDLSGWTALHWV